LARKQAKKQREKELWMKPLIKLARSYIVKFSQLERINPLFRAAGKGQYQIKIKLTQNYSGDGLNLRDRIAEIRIKSNGKQQQQLKERLRLLFNEIYENFNLQGGGKVLGDFCQQNGLEMTTSLDDEIGIICCTFTWPKGE
jgi:hypothetical protein